MAAILISLTIAITWLGALLVWLAGDTRPRLQHTLAVLFSILSGVCAVILLTQASAQRIVLAYMGPAFGELAFRADGLGAFLAVVATVVGSLAVIFSVDYMHGEPQLGRYYAFVLFFIGAMVGLVLSTNLLVVFIFWEITALCSYALISFHNDDPKAVAGGIKALIMTQFGGIGLLAGALLLKATLGSYELDVLLAHGSSLPGGILAAAAYGFLVAAAAKSAQFPFQTWLPDAMEAPSPISALIHAATMVNAGVYLLARFYPAFKDVPGWTTALILVGMLSALLAGIMALTATDLKRVLAYSTVSQLGYMVYAIGTGGVYASMLHLMSHSVFKALLFLAAGAVIHATGTRDITKMGGLGKQMPLVRTVFVIGALALAGIPVLNGFWSKELVLEAGLLHGPLWAYMMMLLVAGLTAMYTLRCVWMVFYGEPRQQLHGHDAGKAMSIALVLLGAGTFLTELLAGPFARLLEETLPYHTIEALSTYEVFLEVLTAPATLLALAVVALGLAAWWFRGRLAGLTLALKGISWAAVRSFGFETLNRLVTAGTQVSAEALRDTQTGLLAGNIAMILGGLVIVLILLVLGV
jgi:NADH-quinone oxidoreductase subunit L